MHSERGIIKPMISNPILRKVISLDLLTPIIRPYLNPPISLQLLHMLIILYSKQLLLQYLIRSSSISNLIPFLLNKHLNIRRDMRRPTRRISLIHTLPPCALRPAVLILNLILIQQKIKRNIGLDHHRHRTRMQPAFAFCLWHSDHFMHTGLAP
jgi:hypothetical protein